MDFEHAEMCLYRDRLTGGLQISIEEVDVKGGSIGYRIVGPKFSGNSEVLHRHKLTARDAEQIRRSLDRVGL